MNPLTITWSPLRYTNIGFENFTALNDSGFVNIKCSQNGVIHKKMARLCLEEFGDAFLLCIRANLLSNSYGIEV